MLTQPNCLHRKQLRHADIVWFDENFLAALQQLLPEVRSMFGFGSGRGDFERYFYDQVCTPHGRMCMHVLLSSHFLMGAKISAATFQPVFCKYYAALKLESLCASRDVPACAHS